MAEGEGRGGTSGGRWGDCGYHGGPPGTPGAVAQLAAAERGASGCAEPIALGLCGGGLRVRHLGIGRILRGLAQAFDPTRRLICRGGVQIGQTQLTILRLHMPWAGLPGVRALMAVASRGDLGSTSPQDKSWRSMSGGPGKPSGVTWRSQGRPPRPPDGPDGPTTCRPDLRWRGRG